MTIYAPLPFAYNGIAHSAQGPGEARSHSGALHWGWDFSPDDQTLLAYGPGVVIDRRDTFPSGVLPAGTADSDIGNFITVQYAPNTDHSLFVTYGHLRQNSIPDYLVAGVTFGMGDTLGVSGDTGDYIDSESGTLVPYSNHVHLHFGDRTDGWQVGEIADGSAVAGDENYVSLEQSVSGPVVFVGNDDDDVFFSNARGMEARGGGGDDHFYSGLGSNQIDGGAGTNTVVYNHSKPNYDIYFIERPAFSIAGAEQVLVVEGPDGTDTLSNIQWITFRDAGGPPFQSIDVTALDGYGDLHISDLSATGNSYDFTMGSAWLTNANSTPAVATTPSDWGINDLVQGAQSLWDAFTSLWTVGVANAADGSEFVVFSSGGRTVAVESNTTALDFGRAGSLAIADLIDGEAPDDHANTSSGAVSIGSGAITSFTSAQGTIESRSDVDVFEAQLQGGQEYSFLLWANTTENSRLDPELTIRSPSGTVWRNDNLTNNTTMAFLTFVAPQSGTYVFEARGVGDSTGSYWLNITPINIDPTANTLTPTTGHTDPGNSSWEWQGTEDDDSFPTPGWDPHKGDLDAANRLRGHDGDDRIEAGRGDDIVWGDDGEDRLEGGDGDDTIRGGRHDDRIDGDDGDDLIYGEDGDDDIDGDTTATRGFGHDTIYGGDGDDTIDGSRGDDYIKGEDDNDDIDGNDGYDELYGDRGDDTVDGGDGDDIVFGGRGNDDLQGGEGRDRLAGEDGNDTLEGEEGDDALYGGDDDDLLQGGEGDDLLHGEDGTDTADFSDGRDGVIVNLFDEIAVSNELGTDRLYDIENVTGSRGDDVIDGDHSRNVLRGDDNDDIIRGHDGNDTIFGDDDDDVVWGDEGDDYVHGGDDEDEVRGGLGNDHLFGDAGDDLLRGEQGDDVIDGGTGTDTVFFWGEHDDFLISAGGGGEVIVADLRIDGLEGRDVLANVEYIEFFDGKALVSDLLAAPPSAASDTFEVAGDRPAKLALLANDAINSTSARYVSAEVISGLGSASIIGGQLIYDPAAHFSGLLVGQTASVTVEYTFATTGFQTATGTAALTVIGTEAVNVPPTVSAIDVGSVTENSEVVTVDLLSDAEASDSDGGTLGVANVSVRDQVGDAVAYGLIGTTLTIDPKQFAAELSAGESATLTVAYDVTDGQGGVTPNTGQLVVAGLDGPFTWYLDADGDGFGIDDPSTNQTAYEAPTGTSNMEGDADDLVAAVFPGAPEINDGMDNDQDGDVDEDNTDPVADAENFEVPEDSTLTVAAAALLDGDTDADGDVLELAGVSNAENGTVSLDDKGDEDASNDEVTFTPTPGFSGFASFDYTVADGFGGSALGTVSISVVEGSDGSEGGDEDLTNPVGGQVIDLAGGQDVLRGPIEHFFNDVIKDFGLDDTMVFESTAVARSAISVTYSSGMVSFHIHGDGTSNGEFTLDGDFSTGDFMAVGDGGDTLVTFETFLPVLREGQSIDPSLVNGIINQNFLKGDGATDFRVTLRDLGYAGYDNVLGVYEVDAVGNIIDTRILFQNVNADKAASALIEDVEEGHDLGFFVVQDAADWAATLASTDILSFVNDSGGAANISDGASLSIAVNGAAIDEIVFHSFDKKMNSDGLQHALSGVEVGGEALTVGFEDLTGGGDRDYEDVAFRVELVDELAFV